MRHINIFLLVTHVPILRLKTLLVFVKKVKKLDLLFDKIDDVNILQNLAKTEIQAAVRRRLLTFLEEI